MKPPVRKAVAIAGAAALVITLAGCGTAGGAGGEAELSDEPVTLRMAWWGGDGRHERTQQVIDLFEEEYPNITVEPEFSDWSGYWEKLATSTAGNNSPDVMQMDQLYLASYADRGTLADLGSLDVDMSGMEDSVRDSGLYEGTSYAAPISTSMTAMLVNTDLLEQIGVPLPENADSWTWEEYRDWGAAVTAASPAGTYGASIPFTEYQLQLFVRQHGEELFDEDGVAVSPEVLSMWFQNSLELSESGASAPASVWAESAGLPLDQTPMAVGAVASFPNTATLVSAYSGASGANIELLPLPRTEDGVEDFEYSKPGMYWSISSQSEHPAEAAALVDFFINNEEAAEVLGAERGLPATTNALDAIFDQLSPEEQSVVSYSESREPFIGSAPDIVPNGASNIQDVLQRYQQEVLFGQTSPDDAAAAMIAELQQAIDAA
ncbi:carbohydrate ABC transporter substrate-binding protein (CUT1 family) [Microbacterium sp. SLBN-154]|uniref:ABC transporter substrate-binding protein n=1 Tax=Microbacterium sp. SLBN-154 TaxID=2768458 RepID=UPI0011674940|nr:extracellular solute-binding protein [Microbacterium sp. SLBN-154]TQK20730.1 carbohydrate ABC transporter substrate-binding protein (CUT1 family) [Microbacterium sp. SLBN-154]